MIKFILLSNCIAHVTGLSSRQNNQLKIKGISFIVNGVKDANLGYGGRYGYGYGKPTKKWWKLTG